MKTKYKTVLFPIEVPSHGYCWDTSGNFAICQYFDNSEGPPICSLHFSPIKRVISGYIKPDSCSQLKEI
jgi:hypothetical protein